MSDSSIVLEARVQRLFLAQGVLAERGLFPAADVGHKMLATDIDVLVSEYASGFHLTRRHVECKSGKQVKILDRILWLSGVRGLLGADASYLVLESFDEDAAEFAKSLGIDVMTIKQLGIWEKALAIPADQWPNRSDFKLNDPIRRESLNSGRPRGALKKDRVIRQAIQFVEIDSWREFGYSRLNRLLGFLNSLSDEPDNDDQNELGKLTTRYAVSLLLVRLSQYLLAVCHDVSRVPLSDIESYLLNKLTFGDQDSIRARKLIQTSIDWMSQALKDRNMSVPPEVNAHRLFQPPPYSDGLVALIQKLLAAPNEARYLPVAMDTIQFGMEKDITAFPRLQNAMRFAKDLVALVRGFTIASLGVESSLLIPIRKELQYRHTAKISSKKKGCKIPSNQTKLM